MGAGFEQIGDPSQSTNLNPLTGDISQLLQQQLGTGNQQASSLIQQILSGQGGFDFLNVIGDPILQGAIGQFAGERNTLADQAAQQTLREISGQFAGTALHSGAFGEAVGRGVGEARQAAVTDIAGLQSGLFGQALQSAAGLQGQGQGQALGFLGQQVGGALGGLASLAQPQFFDPTFAYDPGLLGGLGSLVGLGTSGILGGLGLKELGFFD